MVWGHGAMSGLAVVVLVVGCVPGSFHQPYCCITIKSEKHADPAPAFPENAATPPTFRRPAAQPHCIEGNSCDKSTSKAVWGGKTQCQ